MRALSTRCLLRDADDLHDQSIPLFDLEAEGRRRGIVFVPGYADAGIPILGLNRDNSTEPNR